MGEGTQAPRHDETEGAAGPPSSVPTYHFFSELARTFNAGQSRSVLLHGDIHGLFHAPEQPRGLDEGDGGARPTDGRYMPLVPYLCQRCAVPGMVVLVYELNGPIRCVRESDRERLRQAWVRMKTGVTPEQLVLKGLVDAGVRQQRETIEQQFDELTRQAIGQPAVALEFLRQLTLCPRPADDPFRLLMIVEAADLLLPAGGEITHLNPADRHRISIMQDWLSDPAFAEGHDSLVLLSESRSGVHPRITRLPQVVPIEVPAPDAAARLHYIATHPARPSVLQHPGGLSDAALADATAGLSLHDLRQLLVRAAHQHQPIAAADVTTRVEQAIVAQLGEDVVGFARPTHTVTDLVGFARLKAFLRDELIPRIRMGGDAAIPGAAIAGPIGSGKTYIFEAVAGDLGLPVLTLKNIRSQYFGQTDVTFERLRRVLTALGKVVIIVDEADTQFGGLGGDVHPTERRLTGKLQAMMSDPALRGRVVWLLMTARIEMLSPDLRRPGRVGDLIIPVLDPAPGSDDHRDFARWLLQGARLTATDDDLALLMDRTAGFSAAAFAALRSQLKAAAALAGRPLTFADVQGVLDDHLPADIGAARRRQELHALINCTRRSLLPDPQVDEAARAQWRRELESLRGA